MKRKMYSMNFIVDQLILFLLESAINSQKFDILRQN